MAARVHDLIGIKAWTVKVLRMAKRLKVQ